MSAAGNLRAVNFNILFTFVDADGVDDTWQIHAGGGWLLPKQEAKKFAFLIADSMESIANKNAGMII